MGHKTRQMLSRPHRRFLKYGAASAALAVSLLAAPLAHAQEGPAAGGSSQAGTATPSSSSEQRPSGGVSDYVGSLIPGFAVTAAVNLSETYATNVAGFAGNARSDWITLVGGSLQINEHSARVSLDASYHGSANFYANGNQSTQFINDLQAVGSVIAIPDYLTFVGRAFAQPVVISNVGVATANGSVASNGFRNSYGLSGGPDLTFHFGNFADSDTTANYGAAYFTNPGGNAALSAIPGVRGPQNMVMRSINETLTSGTDFSRLIWTLSGVLQELDRPQGLFSEKVGLGHFQYAITREISLLATGGYDAISNTTPLTRDVSGPVATGGVGITVGEDLYFQVEVGQKYNSASYQGVLRWNITPNAALTGSATDTITTPEGQLLNSLSNLTSSANGTLTSIANVYASGAASSLGSFSAQPSGSLSYNQNISRYQRIMLNYSQDFDRDHATVSLYGMKQTILDTFYFGTPNPSSWGAQANFAHDLTRLFTASVGGGYTNFQELGGHAQNYNIDGQLTYTLSPDTRVYFRTDYLTRRSSSSLQSLSPFTGNLSDVRVTVGLSHTL